MEKEREGFPMTALREANILLSMHHPNVVDVSEMVVGNSLDSVYMVMEFAEHDLKGLMETMPAPFSTPEVKCLTRQLLSGVAYLHDNWVLHRDLKTSNVLVNNRGQLKICDFGLARHYGDPLTRVHARRRHAVVSRARTAARPARTVPVDCWSLGCIVAELLGRDPLFQGKSEIDQIDRVFRLLGTPNEKIWPNFEHLPGVRKVKFAVSRITTSGAGSRRCPRAARRRSATSDSTSSIVSSRTIPSDASAPRRDCGTSGSRSFPRRRIRGSCPRTRARRRARAAPSPPREGRTRRNARADR